MMESCTDLRTKKAVGSISVDIERTLNLRRDAAIRLIQRAISKQQID